MSGNELSRCSRVYLDYLEVELREDFNKRLMELLLISADRSLSTKQLLTEALGKVKEFELQVKQGVAAMAMYEECERTGALRIPYCLFFGDRG